MSKDVYMIETKPADGVLFARWQGVAYRYTKGGREVCGFAMGPTRRWARAGAIRAIRKRMGAEERTKSLTKTETLIGLP